MQLNISEVLLEINCRQRFGSTGFSKTDETDEKSGKTQHSGETLLPVERSVDSTDGAEPLTNEGQWAKITV